MIYKNYISGKNLSRLDIYIGIFVLFFLLAFIITVGRFFFIFLFYSSILGFFCKLWRLVNANCNFCILIFCIIYILICLVLITNICYLLTS